jgi:hypothetical protein
LADELAAELAAIQALGGDSFMPGSALNNPVYPMPSQSSSTWIIFLVVALGIGGYIWYESSKHKE